AWLSGEKHASPAPGVALSRRHLGPGARGSPRPALCRRAPGLPGWAQTLCAPAAPRPAAQRHPRRSLAEPAAALPWPSRPAPTAASSCPEWRLLSDGRRTELAQVILTRYWRCTRRARPSQLPARAEGGQRRGPLLRRRDPDAQRPGLGVMLQVPRVSGSTSAAWVISLATATVVQDYSYLFFLRMDENYNLLPHGVNFQGAIF
uniref:Uncharacterized protein n=1 Tax=Sus scrofa TaxID=9823 RepID=A0A8D1F718_PIG